MTRNLLDEKVLILNKGYQPVYISDVRDALTLLITGKVVVLDEQYNHYSCSDWLEYSKDKEENIIKTPKLQFVIPQVVRLLEYDQTQSHLISYTRDSLFCRDNYTCQYCGKELSKREMTIDHVIPRSRRTAFGLTEEEIRSWNNTTTACKECNTKKGSRTPEEANMTLLSKPKKPKWFAHVRGLFCKKDVKQAWKSFITRDKEDE